MDARAIKSLGDSVWGCQGGLLSVSELEALMQLVDDLPGGPLTILEVGHYFGLSTCAIVMALRRRLDSPWSMLTLDAHIADPWVQHPAPRETFEANREKYFADPRLSTSYEVSQTLSAGDLAYDFIFYDGDHGPEQLRFTRAVIEALRPRIFVFDDRDFSVPVECRKALVEAGWKDESPPCVRFGGDKATAQTMTLGVFRR